MTETSKDGDRSVERDAEAAEQLDAKPVEREGYAEHAAGGKPGNDDRPDERAAAGTEAAFEAAAADHGTGSGSDSIFFQNNKSIRVFVAYMYRDWACLDDCGKPWNVKGWIVLDPGQRQSRPNPTENKWFCYFVEDANGGTTTGGSFPAEIRNQVFSKCTCVGTTGDPTDPFHEVLMLAVDTDRFDGVEIN